MNYAGGNKRRRVLNTYFRWPVTPTDEGVGSKDIGGEREKKIELELLSSSRVEREM